MPRLGRVVLPHYPHHVVQRGHNKQVVFAEGLGATESERASAYRDFVYSAIPVGEWDLICEALQRGQLTGSQRFVDQVEAILGRRIEHRKQGRPRKNPEK